MGQSTEMLTLVSMLFWTFLNPFKLLMEISHTYPDRVKRSPDWNWGQKRLEAVPMHMPHCSTCVTLYLARVSLGGWWRAAPRRASCWCVSLRLVPPMAPGPVTPCAVLGRSSWCYSSICFLRHDSLSAANSHCFVSSKQAQYLVKGQSYPPDVTRMLTTVMRS